MEKRVTRLFCGLFVCVLFLLSTKVSRAEESQSFFSVMKNDTKLCETPKFLHNSSLTKICRSIDYPKEELKLDYKNLDTFMCLVLYDTWYKLCSYSNHWQNSFNTSAAFDSYIQKYLSGKKEEDKEKFCKVIKGVTPMYEKTRTFLMPFVNYINDNSKCHKLCFDLLDELTPTCALLAWIKNIDEGVQKTATIGTVSNPSMQVDRKVSEESQKSDVTQSHASVKPADSVPSASRTQENVNKPKDYTTVDNDNAAMPVDEKDLGEHKNEAVEPTKKGGNIGTQIQTEKQIPENSLNKSVKPMSIKDQSEINNAAPVVPDVVDGGSSKAIIKEKLKNTVNNIPNKHSDITNSAGKDSIKASNEEIKTSTISENTQDHGGRDYSHANDDIYEPHIDAQPIDTNDKNQNIPEPSEQREILPRYHNIQPEEDSHFFTYFTVVPLVCIAAYIGYHNKQKILAIVLEGRRSRNNRGRRRPSTASYRKLDCTLEEAVTSQCNANVTHVIY